MAGEAAHRRWLRRATMMLAACAAAAAASVLVGVRVDLTEASGADASVARTALARARLASVAVPVPVPAAVKVSPRQIGRSWTHVASVGGRPAVWLARRPGVTLMRVDQRLVHLALHAGSKDGGTSGWLYGDRVVAGEAQRLVAAVNGGFKLTYTNVGFVAGHHVAVPLKAGLASIVTYADGTTDIGAWRAGVPAAAKSVFSVLQNQHLLVDRGVAAPTVSTCVIQCWGGTIGLVSVVARSGLGITAGGQLVWAGGENLSPSDLAAALIAAGAVRAIELDINPAWVAGYLYVHGRGGARPVAVVAGQRGIRGAFLKPYTRDFLTFAAN